MELVLRRDNGTNKTLFVTDEELQTKSNRWAYNVCTLDTIRSIFDLIEPDGCLVGLEETTTLLQEIDTYNKCCLSYAIAVKH